MPDDSADVIRLIGGTIYSLQTIAETCSNIDDTKDLPQAFHGVAKRLPLVQQVLVTAKSHIFKSNTDKEQSQDLKAAVQICKDKAIQLEEIFCEVLRKSDTPRIERYRKVAGRGERVEGLMKVILKNVLALIREPTLKEAIGAQVEDLQKALEEVSAIQPSLPDDETSQYTFTNHGSGWMNVNTGTAPQNNNNSSGNQFNGVIHGLQLAPTQPSISQPPI
jgi:hypothetical protein